MNTSFVWNQGTPSKTVLRNIFAETTTENIYIRNKEESKTRHVPQNNSRSSVVAFADQSKSVLL